MEVSKSLRAGDVEASGDLTNWTRFVPAADYFDNPTNATRRFLSLGPSSGEVRFFRTKDGYIQCLKNLRHLEWAKQQLYLESGQGMLEPVLITDLVGPSKYIKTNLVCPNGGVYQLIPMSVQDELKARRILGFWRGASEAHIRSDL